MASAVGTSAPVVACRPAKPFSRPNPATPAPSVARSAPDSAALASASMPAATDCSPGNERVCVAGERVEPGLGRGEPSVQGARRYVERADELRSARGLEQQHREAASNPKTAVMPVDI
jgi:hypothetical protein